MKILDVISLGNAIKERRKELNYTQKIFIRGYRTKQQLYL